MDPGPAKLEIREARSAADRRAFLDLGYRLNEPDPNWVAPLRGELKALIDPRKNPWFEHGRLVLFLAARGGRVTGRISAQIDELVLSHMGAGLGQWGLFDAEDEESARALLGAAETWLKDQGMVRSMGPFSLGIWDEPGLLIEGHDHPPMVMMGHHPAAYRGWIERSGYQKAKDLYTFDTPVDRPFPPIVQRIVAAGEKNPRIVVRRVNRKRFDEEAELILSILNQAWSGNWGFIPLTDSEIAYAGRKLKPIVLEELIHVAEYDGEPVAFMMGLPDINEFIADLGGSLLPFGWAKLLWRLKRMRPQGGRVPLMGVIPRLHATRLASQLAFMMIESIRRAGHEQHGIVRAEIGWILEDNGPMLSIGEAIGAHRNRTYRIYEKPL